MWFWVIPSMWKIDKIKGIKIKYLCFYLLKITNSDISVSIVTTLNNCKIVNKPKYINFNKLLLKNNKEKDFYFTLSYAQIKKFALE